MLLILWNCCSWHSVTRQHWSNVSQESVKSQLIYRPCSVLYLLVKDRLNVHGQLKQQPVTIASVVSVGNVSVNHQSSIMVRYRWCIGPQSASLVQPRPLAFPCDTRYLSTNTWWTLLLVIQQVRLIWKISGYSQTIFMYWQTSWLSVSEHISRYIDWVSVKSLSRIGRYTDQHVKWESTEVLAVILTKCQWYVGELSVINHSE